MIQGGQDLVGFYDPIILELIPEIGYTASLASSWSCSPAPCFSPLSPGIQVVDKTMYVASGQLNPGTYLFRITLSMRSFKHLCLMRYQLDVTRFPNERSCRIRIRKTFGKISSDTTLSLDGSPSSSSKGSPSLLRQQIFGDATCRGPSKTVPTPKLDAEFKYKIHSSFLRTQAMAPKQNFVFRLTAMSPE